MGSYTYKDLCYRIPDSYTDGFEAKYGREFDCDSNYNGDYWLIADDYVTDLQNEIERLKQELRSK